jgi:hypothetical protein
LIDSFATKATVDPGRVASLRIALLVGKPEVAILEWRERRDSNPRPPASFVYAGPMFDLEIPVVVGETVVRDQFVFADLIRVSSHAGLSSERIK